MKCDECGATMTGPVSSQIEDYEGISGLTVSGVERWECSCGNDVESIPQIGPLHQTIAEFLARRPGRLAGAELRFLRSYAGWSRDTVATTFGTTPTVVAAWETGTPIPPGIERAFRILVIDQRDPLDAPHTPATIQHAAHGWELRAA